MGLFDWLTSGTKAAENATEIGSKLTSGIVNGIDMLVLTDEEKIKYQAQSAETVLKFWDTFTKENTIRSLTRRILAVGSFIMLFMLMIVSIILYRIDLEYAKFTYGIIKDFFWLWMMIAGTYFIPYQVAKVWKSENAD